MHGSITLQGPEAVDVPVLQAAALPKLDAGFGFLSAPVVEQALVLQAPVIGSPAQPAQPTTVAAPAQDTRQASPASRPVTLGAPAEPADPQHSPSGLRTAVPEAAVGSAVPAWEPARVDCNGAPVEEPAWMPLAVDQGAVQHPKAGPGFRAGSQQAALLRSQVRVCIYLRGKGMSLCSDSSASVSGHKTSALLCRERGSCTGSEEPQGTASAPQSWADPYPTQSS